MCAVVRGDARGETAFQFEIDGAHVSVVACAATVNKWCASLTASGDTEPMADLAFRFARAHTRMWGAVAGETWVVRFTGSSVECLRVKDS